MNLNDITLDDILAGMKTQNDSFDATGIDILYHEKFPQELKRYVLVKPFEINSQIGKGSIIRYIRPSDNPSISASIMVVHKVYIDKGIYINKKRGVLDHLVVSYVHNNSKVWKIYPSNYYIFKYDPYAGDRRFATKLLKIAKSEEKKGKKIKYVSMQPKNRHNIFKNMGMTDIEANKQLELEEKIDNIFENSKNKRVTYNNIKVNQENLDEILDMIIPPRKK
jgi:hypothetical protein